MPPTGKLTRRHPSAVPASMIERAARHRALGDWRGACAAACVDVDVYRPQLRRKHGSVVAAEVEADLEHLVPDLLRWYLPHRPDGRLVPAVWAPLRLLPDDHALVARAPARLDQPQRVSLRVVRRDELSHSTRDDSLLYLRGRWDSRHTADLLARCGGGDRLPLFTADGHRLPNEAPEHDAVERALLLDESGRHADAWRAAGFDLDVLLFEPGWDHRTVDPEAFGDDADRARPAVVDRSLAWLRPLHSALPRAARQLRDHPDHPDHPDGAPDVVRIDLRGRCVVLDRLDTQRPRARLVARSFRGPVGEARHKAEEAAFGTELARVPSMPLVLARRPAELSALLSGDLRPADLHPLVQAVLFPERAPRVPPVPAPRGTARIRCHDTTHEVVQRDGAVVIPHTRAEIDRERVVEALGGVVHGCVAAQRGWRDQRIRMPRAMRAMRARFLAAVMLGDAHAVAAALDAGFDPHVRDDRGRTLLHLLPWQPDHALLPRLLAAGLDVNARDDTGETPLHSAVSHGWCGPCSRPAPTGTPSVAGRPGRPSGRAARTSRSDALPQTAAGSATVKTGAAVGRPKW